MLSEPFFNNRALFSDYYLTEHLPHSPEWNNPGEAAAMTRAFKQLRELYADVRATFSNQPEAVVRAKLLEPVLRALGFAAQTAKASHSDAVQPGYRLYAANNTAQTSTQPLALCLAYTWGRNLDGKDEQRDTQVPYENPGAAVVTLLDQGEADWAIVTNGKTWRLYAAKAHSRATNYYEIDLEETLALPAANLGYAFHYFWLLFRAAAFISTEQGTGAEQRQMCFLDRLLSESERYAKELGERLKERVSEEIFPHFAEGFIIHARNTGLIDTNLDSLDDEQRNRLLEPYFSGTLTFLYRLLFLLYAESRDLLPVRGYHEKSLEKLKREIAQQAGAIEDEASASLKAAYNDISTALYDRLQELFQTVDQGDAALNVPVYHGGLFATRPDPADTSPEADVARFLATHKIPDRALALGLDPMARDIHEKRHDLVFIDYKSLGVRQLGSIYEGLLEFKLRIAPVEMAVVKGKKTEEIVPYAEAQQKKLPILKEGRGKYDRTLPRGAVYLENDRRERKATGSYYTPDYIVKYIVANTVGPALHEKLEALRPAFREAEKTLHAERARYDALKKQGRVGDSPENQVYLKHRAVVNEAFFDLKVLDPAMGSGHFLVEAVDYITDRMAGFLTAFKWNPVIHELAKTRQEIQEEMERQGVTIDMSKLSDINLLKRQVLKRCIYGVDLNPMAVELARVSLWLDCFTLGAPLSFLDHHMKCGNSLIGGSVQEVQDALSQDLFGYQFAGLLHATELMRHVGELSDVTAQEVAESRKAYKGAYDALAPFKRLLDVWISEYFGNKGAKHTTRVYTGAIVANNYSKANEQDRQAIAAALALARDKCFFHWELEFPEVFYDETKRKENGGFDAVVGNPPYEIVFDIPEKRFLEAILSSFVRNNDRYVAFSEKCVSLLRAAGFASLIIPNTFVMGPYFNRLKEFWLTNTQVIFIDDFGYTVLFPDPHVFSAIFLCKKHSSGSTQETSLREASVQSNQVYYLGEGSTLLSKLPLETWKIFNPVMQKAIKHGTPLKDLCLVKDVGFNYWTKGRGKTRGESIGSRILYAGPQEHPEDIPFLKGGDFSRYETPASRDHWLRHAYKALLDLEVDIFRFSPEFLKVPMKIVYRQTADNIVATLDPAGYLVDKTVHIVLLKAGIASYSYAYLLAALNSKLVDRFYNNLAREEGRAFSQVKTFRVEQLPIRRIWFTTPPQARAYHLEKARNLYDYCMTKNDQACVTGFVEHHLSKEPEESDVVHDLLAFLAEEMIRLNKEKRGAQRGFLDWLVATLKILPDKNGHEGIEVLTGKSKLLDYLGDYQKGESPLAFAELQDILLKNKGRLGVILSDSRLVDEIRMRYEDSLGRVLPIKERLARTDTLIDQVVYRLYGLTEEEIKCLSQ